MKIRNIKLLAALAVVAFSTTGCLDKIPEDAIAARKAIQTVSDAEQAVIGIYADLKSSSLYSGLLTLAPDIQADLVYAVEGYSNNYGDLWRWDFTPTSKEIEAVYATLYEVIGSCNFFLAYVEQVRETATDDRDLDQLEACEGEVYFARALAYSELIKLYCKAYDPATADTELGVVLTDSYYNPGRMVRASLKDSYRFVLDDLKKAEDYIRLDETNNSVYFTKSTVNALRARVYLYMQDWQNAVKYSTLVINDKSLGLSSAITMYTDIYSEYEYMWNYDAAVEIIWKVGFTPTSLGGELGRLFLGYDFVTYRPDYIPALDVYNSYSEHDLRREAFFDIRTTGYDHGLTWPLLFKYGGNVNIFNATNRLFINMPKVFRLSEQYLIRAEAYCQLSEFGKAGSDITTLRVARIENYGVASVPPDKWLDVISEERVKELYMEGFRLQDLKRWHRGFEREEQQSTSKMGNKLKIKADDPRFVWPIPQHELDSPGSEIQPNESNK